MFTSADLTLYRITTDSPDVIQSLYGADDLLVLGRDAANEAAEDLICREDVLTVTTVPLAWGSDAELDALVECDGNGADLLGALVAVAQTWRSCFVPAAECDTTALLDALRDLTREPVAA